MYREKMNVQNAAKVVLTAHEHNAHFFLLARTIYRHPTEPALGVGRYQLAKFVLFGLFIPFVRSEMHKSVRTIRLNTKHRKHMKSNADF